MSIKSSVENIITSYLTSQAEISYPVHRGQTGEEKRLPIILAYVESIQANQAIPDVDENYLIDLKVIVMTSAQDALSEDHQAEVLATQAVMRDVETIKSLWDPETDGIMYDLWATGDEEGRDEGSNDYGNILSYRIAMVAPVI